MLTRSSSPTDPMCGGRAGIRATRAVLSRRPWLTAAGDAVLGTIAETGVASGGAVISMDEVAENVATRDDAVARGGLAGRRAALAYALVGPPLIVVGDILAGYLPQAPLAHNEQVIQGLRAHTAIPAFRHRMRVRRPERSADDLDGLAREGGVEARGECSGPIIDEEADGRRPGLGLLRCVARLLRDPRGGWGKGA